MTLTYRGKPVAKLEPIEGRHVIQEDDPIYQLAALATPRAKPLSNEEMDRILYGQQ